MTDLSILTRLTADIVSAMVQSNRVDARDVPQMIVDVHATLETLGKPADDVQGTEVAQGAVSVRKSLSALPDKIISMIDGRPYSSLKRHIATHGLTPDSYRARFGLKADYPMIAPAYSERRRELSIALGLGKKAPPPPPPAPRKRAKKAEPIVEAEPEIVASPEPEPQAAPAPEKPKRQRKPKPVTAEAQPESAAAEEPTIEERVVVPDPDAEFFPDD